MVIVWFCIELGEDICLESKNKKISLKLDINKNRIIGKWRKNKWRVINDYKMFGRMRK